MRDEDWKKWATNTIKAELAKVGVDYEELVRRSAAIGVQKSYTAHCGQDQSWHV